MRTTTLRPALHRLLLTLVLIALTGTAAQAQVPNLISHQGVLQDADGLPLDGPHTFVFQLFDAAEGGAARWTETHTDVEVIDGLFTVLLGSIEPLDLAFDGPLWLSLAVDGEAPLAPRLPLTSAPYSLTAKGVQGETNTFPADGNVGIGTEGSASKTAAPQAKLDVEGDLRIAVVPEAQDPTKVLVQEDDNQFVKFVPIEDLVGGFTLPFEGTVNTPTAAFSVTNDGGNAVPDASSGKNLQGTNNNFVAIEGRSVNGYAVFGRSTSGIGVVGISMSAAGVFGTSDDGAGVSSISSNGPGVSSISAHGPGIAASGTPAAQLKGTVEILTDGIIGRMSRLKIEELEEDPNEDKVLVWSGDQFVRYKTLDDSGFDGTLDDTDLVITDANGNETTRINADGTSFHAGPETFRGGILFDGAGVGITFNDGTTQTTGFSLPFSETVSVNGPAFTVTNETGEAIKGVSNASTDGVLGQSNGGRGVFGISNSEAGVLGVSQSSDGVAGSSVNGAGVSGGSEFGPGIVGFGEPAARLNGTVEILTDNDAGRTSRLKIQQLEEDPNEDKVLVWSGDQFVRYKTLDDSGFDGTLDDTDLVITDANGNETTRINADGTSFHEGLETYRGGITVFDDATFQQQPQDIFAITNNTGTPRFFIGSTSYFLGDCTLGCLSGDTFFGRTEMLDGNGLPYVQFDPALQKTTITNLEVTGTLAKPAGTFKIDHPLDPANQYLYHSFVESPDMMNVYNGNVTLDDEGRAVVELPDWFEALNRDFRYQLTPIGGPGPNLYVAEEIAGNQFTIAGGAPGLKVSWQVTGVRHDPYAEQHRIPVEVVKPPEERGTYLHPEVYGQPATRPGNQ